jgi:hypothetical protein
MDALTITQIKNMMEDTDFYFINDIKKVNLNIITLNELYEVWDYTPQRLHYLNHLCKWQISLGETKEDWIADCIDNKNNEAEYRFNDCEKCGEEFDNECDWAKTICYECSK